jgi:hypothetical protein
MAEDLEASKKRLRAYLNSSIQGPNTEAILEALATGACHLIDNVEAVNDSLYIATARGRYLDERLAGRDLARPENVGLSDEIFREIGIEVSNRKQVRDLMLNILRIMYGEEFTRATLDSTELETYALIDGDNLIIQYDDQDSLEIVFSASQFTNISAATAQEIADAITKEIRSLGRTGSAIAQDNGLGGFVRLISGTDGPSSTVKVLGGRAQNELKFSEIRPTSGLAATQWTIDLVAGGNVRLIWSGGPNPSMGKVGVGNYVNIFGSAFSPNNRGTFTITEVQSGLVNESYVEFVNPNAVGETQLQGTTEGILFYNSFRSTINAKNTFATVFQVSPSILEVFLPATTKVVRRDRVGAAHLHESGPSEVDSDGPYVYDISKSYLIGAEECNTGQTIDSNSSNIIQVDDSSDIPDDSGYLIFGFGTEKEEGPVPYNGRPSTNSLIIDPSYAFEQVHDANTNISLVSLNSPYDPETDGTDYAFYATDIVSGRIYAEELINLVAATGINVIITILYPDDEGLGKWGESSSEKTYIWGPDPS